MSALEPGLYRATVRGVPDTIVIVGEDGWGRSGDRVRADGYCGYEHLPRHITDARPLIVLDLGAHLHHYVVTDLRNAVQRCGNTGLTALADQIEAQSKPARIPEPGLWGVVVSPTPGHRAGFPLTWVNHGDYWCDSSGYKAAWADLTDPTPVREGLS